MAKLLVYSLPRIEGLKDENIVSVVRKTRDKSRKILTGIGLRCNRAGTLILVPPSNVDAAYRAISNVEELYAKLADVVKPDLLAKLNPIIKIMDLADAQTEQLIPLAQRILSVTIEREISRVNVLLNELPNIRNEDKLRRIRARLNGLVRNWNKIYGHANELNINISEEYKQLKDLLTKALHKVNLHISQLR